MSKPDDAFLDGYAAYPCPADSNPFIDGTKECGSWIDGWLTGKAADAHVRKLIEQFLASRAADQVTEVRDG